MKKHLIAAAFAGAFLTLAGCADESTPPSAQAQFLQPIDVANVLVKPVQSWHTYTTRLESPQEVALMPRVSGVIEQITFNEGDLVKKGDVLFKLDDRPFAAVVASLKAQVSSAQAALEQAKSEAKRAERLTERKAISTEQAESRTSVLRQREAQLAALQAHAYFDVDERTWSSDFSNVTSKSRQAVVMQKVGERDFAYKGYINFIDNQINSSTGTLRVRAVFDQDNSQLRAGSFARIKLAANSVTEQIIVPDRAIGTDLKNRFVLTVGENNVLQYKLVTVGERYGSLRAITSGLSEGDVIAVNGPARVGPGMPVAPNKVTIDSSDVAFTMNNDDSSLVAKQ